MTTEVMYARALGLAIAAAATLIAVLPGGASAETSSGSFDFPAACQFKTTDGTVVQIVGCEPQVSPWIQLNGIFSNAAYTVTCPKGAPFNNDDEVPLYPTPGPGWDFQRTTSADAVPEPTPFRTDTVGGSSSSPGWSHKYSTSWTFHTSHFRFAIGCSTVQASARVAAAGGERHIVRTAKLRPHSTTTRTAKCPRGMRVRRIGAGVGFHTRRPPKGQRYKQKVTHRRIRNGVRVRVATGKIVRNKTVLQVSLLCR